AGFWIRFAAKMIDGIILSIVTGGPYWFLSFKVAMLGAQGNPDPEVIARYNVFLILAYLLMMVLQVAYAAFMVGKYGATLGKLAVGIRVVNADGSKVSYLKAFGRWWGELVTGFTIGIGYIIAGFDREKRALHDHICSTRVVFK
ncbi:MAG: RDD family protein, partial [Verrucomicrobiales bacterium]